MHKSIKLWSFAGDVRPAATMFEARSLNDEMKIEIQITAKISE